jgi:hypothetical protein
VPKTTPAAEIDAEVGHTETAAAAPEAAQA